MARPAEEVTRSFKYKMFARKEDSAMSGPHELGSSRSLGRNGVAKYTHIELADATLHKRPAWHDLSMRVTRTAKGRGSGRQNACCAGPIVRK